MQGIGSSSTASVGTSVQNNLCESEKNVGTSVHSKSEKEREISLKNLTISDNASIEKGTSVHDKIASEEKLLEDVNVIDPEKITESLENLVLGAENENTEKEETLKQALDEWEKSGNSWGEENESQDFGNGGFSGASAQNKNNFTEVKSKGKKNKEEKEEPKERVPKGRRYVISQLQEARLIAVSTSPNKEDEWPLFIEIPWNVLVEMNNEDATDACVGDDIYITKFQLRTDKFRTLNESTWFYQGNINWQATATEVEMVGIQEYRMKTGFVVETRKRGKDGKTGSIRVIAFGMERTSVLYKRQCVEVDWDNLKKGMFIDVALAPIEEGWLIGPNYILPPGCNFRLGTEVLARSNSKIATAAGSFEGEWRWTAASGIPRVFPITQQYTMDEIHLAETLIAAALIVASEEEETSRMETTYVGPLTRVSEENRRNFTIMFASAEKKFIKKVTEIWSKDSNISAQTSYRSKAFAQGHVNEVRKLESQDNKIRIEVEITLVVNQGKFDHQDDFESMLEGSSVILRVREGAGGFRMQAETFGFHLPSIVCERDTPQAEIVKSLLGRSGTIDRVDESELDNLDLNMECVRQLNDKQRHTLVHWLNPGVGRVHFTQAPPGTGKTKIAATCIAAALRVEPESAVLASAMSNLPVTKLVIESARAEVAVDMVAFFSGSARVRYGEQIGQLEEYLLEAKLRGEEYKQSLEKSEAREVEEYLKVVRPQPRHAREKAVGEILMRSDFHRVAFATTFMSAAITGAHRQTTHLILDETTQIPFCTVMHLVCHMPALKSVLLTGDKRQLAVHLAELEEVIQRGFGLESIVEQVEECTRVTTTTLERCYRAHPAIVDCFDFASYRQHGERVIAAVTAEERAGLTNSGIHLPVNGIPVVLIDVEGQNIQDPTSFSLECPEQTEVVLRLVKILEPRDPNIVIICLYTYQAEIIRQSLRKIDSRVAVHTCDSFQAQEQRIVILVTTRTLTKGTRATSDFIKDAASDGSFVAFSAWIICSC
uniref:DNA2/NAM7 helicase-like C-terminal domain-containing protein n=1 Tax=Meloidogyne enterolobii TaxID=390850 RepID=A0A6V7WHA2_MELEN|nr:unnamed protein product [Meloidogyne enterolobii]